MQIFWRKGYLGRSLSDLTNAMGINRPSLYAAFGNKKSLFRKVFDRYSKGPSVYLSDAVREPTARAVVERVFYGVVDLLIDPHTPTTCMWVHGAQFPKATCPSARVWTRSRKSCRRSTLA
jgi:AcrR family transcriptional regulator